MKFLGNHCALFLNRDWWFGFIDNNIFVMFRNLIFFYKTNGFVRDTRHTITNNGINHWPVFIFNSAGIYSSIRRVDLLIEFKIIFINLLISKL